MGRGSRAVWVAATGALLLSAAGVAAATIEHRVMGGGEALAAAESTDTGAPAVKRQRNVVIESIERGEPIGRDARQEVPWLGLGVEEASDAVAAQLGLKAGEGLVVTHVAPNSPAAKAGFQKYDVMVELEGQLLVHPAQFRKLVRLHEEGDTVKITYYRAGKKETVPVTVGKTVAALGLLPDEHAWSGDLRELQRQFQQAPLAENLRQGMKELDQSLARQFGEKSKVDAEVRRSLDEARKALKEALRQATNASHAFGPAAKDMAELIRRGVALDKNATVTINSHGQSVKTLVKTDDTGSYMIVANPRKRLTVHDRDGKLLFEGEIETPEQQDKVPPELWKKVKPLVERLSSDAGSDLEAEDPVSTSAESGSADGDS